MPEVFGELNHKLESLTRGFRIFVGFATLPFVLMVCPKLPADEVKPGANDRFASQTDEVPDFQRHVVPLLGRLGCNGRACHGSFQGRGGFRLSLFGYDFEMDHASLTDEATTEDGSRITASADDSLIILKPSLEIEHEGGQRFELGSWEHRLLERWIENGATGVKSPQELNELVVHPREVVFSDDSAPVQLRVIAHWTDGTAEDVTSLCRFRTNDDSVVTVDADGSLHSIGAGDTHVVAFYDNGVATAAVMKAVAHPEEPAFPRSDSTSMIDRLVRNKLIKLGVIPSSICSDSEFLRRISIDLTGTLPAPEEIRAFLEDTSVDKRNRKIDELLNRPAYAAWWANKLCDFTGCNPRQQAELGQETAVQWYMWVYQRLRENVPYDELIERIVLAKGRADGQPYDDYAREVTSYFQGDGHTSFSQRPTMPHYWSRRTMQEPDDKALAFAHNFLGIRLQCAQCHKHPFAPWTQQDFRQFSELLANVSYGIDSDTEGRYRELAKQVGLNLRGGKPSALNKSTLTRNMNKRVLPWRELFIESRDEAVELNLLRSKTVTLDVDEDPRREVMNWMTEPSNPWFAQAFVNRVWAGYFHTGIVDPPDDINPANPPSHPELLAWLSDSLIEHDFDMKWLHREIVSSETYQRSWKPNETNRDDRRNYSRAIPRRIPAEVVYDGLKQALAASDQLAEVRADLSRRAIGHLSMRLAGTYAMHVFGKPERAVNCDCERSNQPTLLQSVFLQNDPLVEQRINGSGWISELETAKESVDHTEIITEAWLRTLSRPPSPTELLRAEEHLSGAVSPTEGIRDLMWALVNTKEFILNR